MKSQTQLSDFTFTFPFHALEKEMATHSSALAWRIPGMVEPGGLPSTGSHRVGHDWSDLAAAAAAASQYGHISMKPFYLIWNKLSDSCFEPYNSSSDQQIPNVLTLALWGIIHWCMFITANVYLVYFWDFFISTNVSLLRISPMIWWQSPCDKPKTRCAV